MSVSNRRRVHWLQKGEENDKEGEESVSISLNPEEPSNINSKSNAAADVDEDDDKIYAVEDDEDDDAGGGETDQAIEAPPVDEDDRNVNKDGKRKKKSDCVAIRIVNTVIIFVVTSAFICGLLVTFYQEAVDVNGRRRSLKPSLYQISNDSLKPNAPGADSNASSAETWIERPGSDARKFNSGAGNGYLSSINRYPVKYKHRRVEHVHHNGADKRVVLSIMRNDEFRP